MNDRPKIFNGIHTLTNKKTGEWWTFKIRTQPDHSRFKPGERIFSILNGPDNRNNYLPVGVVDGDELHLWRKPSDTMKEVARMIWKILVENDELDENQWEHLLAGTCIICNRTLTTPESVRTGIGPICANRQVTHPDPQIQELLRLKAKIKRAEVEYVKSN